MTDASAGVAPRFVHLFLIDNAFIVAQRIANDEEPFSLLYSIFFHKNEITISCNSSWKQTRGDAQLDSFDLTVSNPSLSLSFAVLSTYVSTWADCIYEHVAAARSSRDVVVASKIVSEFAQK
jgi:hypothetical protein